MQSSPLCISPAPPLHSVYRNPPPPFFEWVESRRLCPPLLFLLFLPPSSRNVRRGVSPQRVWTGASAPSKRERLRSIEHENATQKMQSMLLPLLGTMWDSNFFKSFPRNQALNLCRSDEGGGEGEGGGPIPSLIGSSIVFRAGLGLPQSPAAIRMNRIYREVTGRLDRDCPRKAEAAHDPRVLLCRLLPPFLTAPFYCRPRKSSFCSLPPPKKWAGRGQGRARKMDGGSRKWHHHHWGRESAPKIAFRPLSFQLRGCPAEETASEREEERNPFLEFLPFCKPKPPSLLLSMYKDGPYSVVRLANRQIWPSFVLNHLKGKK